MAAVVAVPGFIVLTAWVLIPPFPGPSELLGKPSSALVSLLGPWTDELPEKFVAWDKSRRVAVWTLEAGYRTWPVEPKSITENVRRCLWIKWVGVSVLCQAAAT